MPDTQTQQPTFREMLSKAGITQKKIAKKAKVSPAAVSLVVAGKSRSQRVEEIIRNKVEKALADGQEV